MCLWTKSKNTTTKQKIKPKSPWWSRELNPGPLAPKADAYRLSTSYLTVLMQWVET